MFSESLVRSWMPSLFTKVSADLRKQWQEEGFAHLKKAVDSHLIDQVLLDLKNFRSTCGETKDEFGYGGRIGLFHVQSQAALAIALNAAVQNFLKWAFRMDPVLFGSLSFEVGTEQLAHRDNIFFFTEPNDGMAGAWTALEDVKSEAGPLFYYPGSHRWPLIRGQDVIEKFPELKERYDAVRAGQAIPQERQALVDELGLKWYELTQRQIEEKKAQSRAVLIEKGDVLIWHGLLVHGGLPRQNRSLTRNSMVVHYIGNRSDFWDQSSYFLLKNSEFNKQNQLHLVVKKNEFGKFIEHDKPVTY